MFFLQHVTMYTKVPGDLVYLVYVYIVIIERNLWKINSNVH